MSIVDHTSIKKKKIHFGTFKFTSEFIITEWNFQHEFLDLIPHIQLEGQSVEDYLAHFGLKFDFADQLISESEFAVHHELDQITSHSICFAFTIIQSISGEFREGLCIVSLIGDRSVEIPSNDMFDLVMDTVPQRVFWKDLELRYLGCNQQFLNDAGFKKKRDLLGKTDFECAWKDSAEKYRQDDLEVIESGKVKTQFEEMQIRDDGTIVWLRTSKIPLKDRNGNIIGVFGSYEDITTQKLAEKALIESETKYRELVNFLPQTLFECDIHGRFIFVSPNGLCTYGYSIEDFNNGLKIFDVIVEEDHTKARDNLREIIKSKIYSGNEYMTITKTGETIPAIISSAPVIRNGQAIGIRGIVFDISEVKDTQTALNIQKQRLKAFINALPDLAFVLDEEGTYLEIICGNEQLLIKDAELLKGRKVREFFPAAVGQKIMDTISETIHKKSSVVMEYDLVTVAGNKAYFQGRTSYLYDPENQKDTVIWVARDITHLRKIQDQLTRSNENLSITLESIGDAVIATDETGRISRINHIAEKLTGLDRTQALGKKIEEVVRLYLNGNSFENPVYKVLQDAHTVEIQNYISLWSIKDEIYSITLNVAPLIKDKRILGSIMVMHDVSDQYKKEKALIKSEKRLKKAQAVAHVGDWEHKPGSDLFCGSDEAFEIIGVKRKHPCMSIQHFFELIHPDDRDRIKEAFDNLLKEGTTFDQTYWLQRKKDQKMRFLRSRAEMIQYDRQINFKILGTIQDITEIKIAEDELKIRNAELNNFVYRVSHDLRAPLSSVKGLINLYRLEKDSANHQYIDLIENSVDKLDRFIRNILSHSRNLNTIPSVERVDFEGIIQQSFEELAYLPFANRIIKDIQVTGVPFSGDKIRVNEILRNLISNSLKYADEKKSNSYINIKISITDKSAILIIEDNGIGIKSERLPMIFDMFYRGIDVGEGSGIGLYIVKQAVEKLNGEIKVESDEGIGTKFMLTLPNQLA